MKSPMHNQVFNRAVSNRVRQSNDRNHILVDERYSYWVLFKYSEVLLSLCVTTCCKYWIQELFSIQFLKNNFPLWETAAEFIRCSFSTARHDLKSRKCDRFLPDGGDVIKSLLSELMTKTTDCDGEGEGDITWQMWGKLFLQRTHRDPHALVVHLNSVWVYTPSYWVLTAKQSNRLHRSAFKETVKFHCIPD